MLPCQALAWHWHLGYEAGQRLHQAGCQAGPDLAEVVP